MLFGTQLQLSFAPIFGNRQIKKAVYGQSENKNSNQIECFLWNKTLPVGQKAISDYFPQTLFL
jgi:hypothetical protein